MKPCFLLVSLSAALACCLASGADSRPSPAGSGDLQNIVFFSDSRPVLIRLHIHHDGKSSQAAWDEFLHHLLSDLDTDKNGILSQEEAARTPPAPVLTSSFLYLGATSLVTSFAPPQANRDGQVTVEELRQYYRKSGLPFQIYVHPGQARAPVLPGSTRSSNQSPNAVALREALYRLLDADQDGRFSREELRAAPAKLLPYDADDDEMVTGQEISLEPDRAGPRMVQVPQSAVNSRGPDSTFWVLAPGESPTQLVEQLLKRYGGKGPTPDRTLTRQESGLDEASFNQLDRNRDGALNSEELAGFAHRLPDLELTIDIHAANQRRGDSTSRVVGAPAARLDGMKEFGQLGLTTRVTALSVDARATPGSAMVVNLGLTTLDLRVGGGTQLDMTPSDSRERYKGSFARADQDNNGSLDANEARVFRLFGALFKRMDDDNDGKLTEKEVLAYFDQTQELRAQVAACCATLSVVDQGSGLVDLFDPNRDGRLSVRELRQAASSLEGQDRNRDGFVSKDEIPHSYIATFMPGAVDMNPEFRGMGMNRPPAQQPGSASTAVRGPVWFRKMDRNQDGDVSRREFVGTDEQFAQIDSDGDGLLGLEEAERADAWWFQTQKASRR
jgi:Ca2+-binding EF-hand superfamily protein